MRRILLIVSFFAGYMEIQAQSMQDLQDFYRSFKDVQLQQLNMNQGPGIEGSPHAAADFTQGRLVTKSNITYENIPLRYNVYQDEMEFRTGEERIYFVASPEVFEHIILGTDKFIYVPYLAGKKMNRGYFKVAAEGKAELLVKLMVSFREAEPPGGYKDAVPAKFVRMPDEYYLRLPPAEAVRVSNQKELKAVLSDGGIPLDEYLKKNKIRYNRLEDMVEVVNFYNSLP